MPFFDRGDARLHYVSTGAGPTILTIHGVAESHLYWTLPGIADALAAAGYRVVSLDMRGHGRSHVAGPNKGYDVETVAGDIGALADHLGLKRFHLLSHATGGMAALRYAMTASSRLLSLMCTNTGSATLPPLAVQLAAAGRPPLSAGFRGRTWLEIAAGARRTAANDPFLNSLYLAKDPDQAFAWYERCIRLGDPEAVADFLDSFYDDPDPHTDRLSQIDCPSLVITGTNDLMFLEPSALLSRHIPNAQPIVMEGRGHMLAFEDPEALAAFLLAFLANN